MMYASDDEDEGKLDRGFMSADALEEVDIDNRDKPRLTFISKKLDKEFRGKLIKLLKEFKGQHDMGVS